MCLSGFGNLARMKEQSRLKQLEQSMVVDKAGIPLQIFYTLEGEYGKGFVNYGLSFNNSPIRGGEWSKN